ncbi:hypothetical protein S40293_01098, partial [Stachybotrys chartarum IBT 40293]
MAFVSPPAVLFAAAVSGTTLLVIHIVRYLLSTRRPSNFPPGPPTILGLGNIHQIPPEKSFLKFHDLSKTYGDIVGLKIGPKNIIILSNPAHAYELFAVRGNKYSGRELPAVVRHYVVPPPDRHVLFESYNDYVKQYRGSVRQFLGPEGIERLAPLHSAPGNGLLYRLLKEPESWTKSLHEWVFDAGLMAITGQRLEDYGPGFAEEYIHVMDEFMHLMEPGNIPPIDMFPFLSYVPSFLAKWKRTAIQTQHSIFSLYLRNLEMAKQRLVKHRDGFPTLLSELLQRREADEKMGLTERDLAFVAGSLLDAAVETTMSAVESMLLCFLAHPVVLQRARREVDDVVGDECPQLADTKRMPYLKACLMEVLRWRGPLNNTVPHVATEDDVFEGYTIPAGTTIIACAYAMHQHEDDFDEPTAFNPDRYMASPYGLKPTATPQQGRKATYAFGVGRRGCPGDEFAKMAVLVACAKLLWAFDWSYAAGEQPDVSWETGYTSGLTVKPRGFQPVVRPRSAGKARRIVVEHDKSVKFMAEAL